MTIPRGRDVSTARDELKAADTGTGPQAAGAVPDWKVIHSGTADSASTPAARAVMRTSDGEFRITASQVDGKVGLTIEMLKPGLAVSGPSSSGAGTSSTDRGAAGLPGLGAKVPEAKVLGRKVPVRTARAGEGAGAEAAGTGAVAKGGDIGSEATAAEATEASRQAATPKDEGDGA
jgi:hypothetical protein